MTTKEMKEILTNKLRDENTYFTKSDISIRKKEYVCKGTIYKDYTYKITIKDYEHIFFTIDIKNNYGVEPYICVYYHEDFQDNEEFKTIIIYDDFTGDKDTKSVLVKLGYFIGTRF